MLQQLVRLVLGFKIVLLVLMVQLVQIVIQVISGIILHVFYVQKPFLIVLHVLIIRLVHNVNLVSF